MQALDESDEKLDEEIETIHLYVVREQPKRPYTFLPLFCAFLCLLGIAALTLYSAEHPYYEHKQLTVPAELLPLRIFTAQVAIVPTGVKIYPATYAHGFLTFSNGSVIGQSIPAAFTIDGVATDQAVYVPAGNADGFGKAAVTAHALTSGKSGNLAALAINQVIGSSLYIRNLSAFSGGQDAYSVKFMTAYDKQAAILQARSLLLGKMSGLHYPCVENQLLLASIRTLVTWRCQFVSYRIPSYTHVLSARLAGTNLVLDVVFTPLPTRVWVR